MDTEALLKIVVSEQHPPKWILHFATSIKYDPETLLLSLASSIFNTGRKKHSVFEFTEMFNSFWKTCPSLPPL